MKYKLVFILFFVQIQLFSQNTLLRKVDSLIETSIQNKNFPGAQIFVKFKDSVIINKSFGHHTYDSLVKVNNSHIYDLASLTKVLASTFSIMKLYDQEKLDLNDKLSIYFKDLKNSNKKNTTIFQSMSHTSGWIPYISHQNLIRKKNGKFKRSEIRNSKSRRFSTQINDSLFLRNSYSKKIFKRIKRSKIKSLNKYEYSGLFFFYVPKLIEIISGSNFEI